MPDKRFIPKISLVWRASRFVAVVTKAYQKQRVIGCPISIARIYEAQSADELQFQFIESIDDLYEEALTLIADIARELRIPIAIGGQINSGSRARDYFNHGADKILLRTAVVANPNLVSALVSTYGSANIVGVVDYSRAPFERVSEKIINYQELDPMVDTLLNLGVGEIVLNSVDRDGSKVGIDLEPLDTISRISCPLILSCGVGKTEHIICALKHPSVDGVAAGNFPVRSDQNIGQIRSQIQNRSFSS